QSSPFPRLAAVEPRGMGIRLWLRGRQGHEGPGAGAGDRQGRDAAQGRSAEVPGVLGALHRLPGEERIQGLAHEAGRYRLVGQTVRVWPLVLWWTVVGAKQLVDPREVDGEVLVDRLRLRRVMPVMESREDQVGLQPFDARASIRMLTDVVHRADL